MPQSRAQHNAASSACAGQPGVSVGTVGASIRVSIVTAQITVDSITFAVAGNIADNATKALNTKFATTSGNVNVDAGFAGSGASSLTGTDFVGTGCILGFTGGDIKVTCPALALNARLVTSVSGQNVDAAIVLSGSLEASGAVASGMVVNGTTPANANVGAAAGRRLLLK